MRSLRTLVLTLIAVLFAVGGMVRPGLAEAAPSPCHEAPAHHEKSTPIQAAMTCCIGCMPAPTDAVVVLTSVAAERAAYDHPASGLEGRLTAPDPDPPRLRV
ncbi:MAG: hypothetical protein K9G59_03485 [Caulobacter sp.]|nr:hypothetical protein [Caulobacter sp.]